MSHCPAPRLRGPIPLAPSFEEPYWRPPLTPGSCPALLPRFIFCPSTLAAHAPQIIGCDKKKHHQQRRQEKGKTLRSENHPRCTTADQMALLSLAALSKTNHARVRALLSVFTKHNGETKFYAATPFGVVTSLTHKTCPKSIPTCIFIAPFHCTERDGCNTLRASGWMLECITFLICTPLHSLSRASDHYMYLFHLLRWHT